MARSHCQMCATEKSAQHRARGNVLKFPTCRESCCSLFGTRFLFVMSKIIYRSQERAMNQAPRSIEFCSESCRNSDECKSASCVPRKTRWAVADEFVTANGDITPSQGRFYVSRVHTSKLSHVSPSSRRDGGRGTKRCDTDMGTHRTRKLSAKPVRESTSYIRER